MLSLLAVVGEAMMDFGSLEFACCLALRMKSFR